MGNRWFVAIVLSLAMAASASEASDVSFDFRDAVGGFGIGRESFDRPVDIVRDRDEHIYVVDQANNRVGNLVKEWPMHSKGEGALCGPSRIRIEPRKYTMYIADTENDRIVLFDKEGEPLGSLKEDRKGFRKPSGLFVDASFGEDLLVADTGNHLIQIFRRTR
ncbi:MAG: NHL repeat-containing protein [Candidatus Deferrimicrobiaceae bacterium]